VPGALAPYDDAAAFEIDVAPLERKRFGDARARAHKQLR
jgi:hypothetical protein